MMDGGTYRCGRSDGEVNIEANVKFIDWGVSEKRCTEADMKGRA